MSYLAWRRRCLSGLAALLAVLRWRLVVVSWLTDDNSKQRCCCFNRRRERWSQIAQHLPGRTDNEIKNHWHSYLKKKLLKDKGMEPWKRAQSDSSNSDIMELSPSPKRLKMQASSLESSLSTEKPSADINRSVPEMFESPKEPKGSSLAPKVTFAEWLSLDSFASLGEPMDSDSTFDHNTSFQDNFMHDCLLDERAFGGECHNSLSHGSSGDIFSSEFKFESQSPGNEFDFSSGEDLCGDFNLSNITSEGLFSKSNCEE